MIAEKLEKESKSSPAAAAAATTSAATPATTTTTAAAATAALAATTPSEPDVNPDQLQWLMDMGFPRERCIEAINNTDTVEQAADFLLNNPPLQPLASSRLQASSARTEPPQADQDELMRAIAMSLGENVMVSTSAKNKEDLTDDSDEKLMMSNEEDFRPLDTATIDAFTQKALEGSLSLLDTLPDTVYKVCDLLLAIFKRNGQEFKTDVIGKLVSEVGVSLERLNSVSSDLFELSQGEEALKASARIHLFTLLYEDCRMICAKAVDEANIVSKMADLLDKTQKAMIAKVEGEKIPETPKWMTATLLFVDLHEKVILGLKRKSDLSDVCVHTWKWFDISQGKWCAYNAPNNKTIDDAFWQGEAQVKFQNSRRKYSIQFSSMMQVKFIIVLCKL